MGVASLWMILGRFRSELRGVMSELVPPATVGSIFCWFRQFGWVDADMGPCRWTDKQRRKDEGADSVR